jgi:tRNA (Thr-GGU) A37 N-methylase
MTEFLVRPIGRVDSTRTAAKDDDWDAEQSEIVLDRAVLGERAAAGLEAFSHIEVIFLFDRVDDAQIESDARRPRNNADWPEVGILAQRGRNRPNRLGATICEVIAVSGMSIAVRGLDAIDGTPVLDIKPVMSGFLPRGRIREPQWAREIMADYW